MRLVLHRFPAAGGLLLFALLCAALAGAQHFRSDATILIVTNTNDNGPGTLRDTIAAANDGDTIQFDPALNGQTITLTSGELAIDKNITISGPGPNLLAVSELYIPKFLYRILHVRPGHIVTIAGLTISGGYANGSVGGGILNDHSTLSINNCTISGNHSDSQGAGLYNNGSGSTAHLTILNSTISGNQALSTLTQTIVTGGGIANDGSNGGSPILTITDSLVDGNVAEGGSSAGEGGGIYNNGAGATLAITNSIVSNNRAGPQAGLSGSQGGGIWNSSAATILGSTINGNQAGVGGGGISNTGTLTITASMINNNQCGGYVSSTYFGLGGGIDNSSGTLMMVDTTFTDNFAGLSGGALSGNGTITNCTITDNYGTVLGGGVYGSPSLTNCTISDNQAFGSGGGIYGSPSLTNCNISGNETQGSGGGIYGSPTVTNSTISGNSAGSRGGGIAGGGIIRHCTITGNIGEGGGILVYNSALEIGSTILKTGSSGANILNDSGTVTSDGYNISSDDGGGFLTAPGDQINTDPILGPLQDNGGPTLTHALLPGSPAINTGDPSFTPPPDFDQRGPGYPRVFNGRIDIGSFEIQSGPTPTPTPPILIVTTTNDDGPGSLRQALADAHNGDIIGFDPALNAQTISLTSGELVINNDISISGPGSDLLTVSRSSGAPQEFRIFHVMPGHTVAIQGLTISGGLIPKFGPGSGAGIFNEQGTLTIDSCTVSSNFSFYEGGGIANVGTLTVSQSTIIGNFGGFDGGGISNDGALTIMNSMVSNNMSGLPQGVGGTTGNGAGIYNAGMATIVSSTIDHNTAAGSNQGSAGGGISSEGAGSLTISNSTISQNVATIKGGAIFGGGSITNCTISGNTAPQGGGIYVASALQIGNTILKAGDSGANILGAITSLGHNLSSDDGGGFLTGPGDQINTDPILGPLQNNGGPTFTHELLPGSPAINTGDPNFTPPPLYDQRGPGYVRVFAGRLDIGSFEVQLIQPTPTATATATPTASPTATATTTASPSPATNQLLNLSTRVRVETGDNVMIGGLIINGAGSLQVAIRGIGPSLGQQGISDFLPDPILELRDSSGSLLGTNDNWQDDPTQAMQLTKLGLAPGNPAESALLRALQPGAYTAIIAGKNGGTGVGLVEVYNVDHSVPVANLELANISTRGFVQTGDNVMIGGFILGGSSVSTSVAVRGIGPSLSPGLSNVLGDPTLELRDSNGALLISNDNWQDDPVSAAQLTAHGLAPQNSLESGIFRLLPPGAFTAILAGKNGGTGIGLVEIYNVD